MEPDKKKKFTLFLIIGGVLILLVIVLNVLNTKKGSVEETVDENVYVELPDGEGTGFSDSKMDHYQSELTSAERARLVAGNRRIDDYFDNIDNPEVDPLAQMTSGNTGGVTEVNMDKFISNINAEAEAKAAQKAKERQANDNSTANEYNRKSQKRVDNYMNRVDRILDRQDAMLANVSGTPAPAPVAETPAEEKPEEVVDRIEVKEVAVRKSGTVSTIDDGMSSLGGTGISSLNGDVDETVQEQDYPFKCSFVKEEKIKSGMRVPIRLLEDMVISGQLIPKNTHLMATCTLSNRLEMNVASIQFGSKVINLNYDAYDANDHIRGIYCPEVDDNLKNAVKNQTGTLGLSRANSMVGGVVKDVISTGTVLISNVGQERSVTVPAGYIFYLSKSKRN